MQDVGKIVADRLRLARERGRPLTAEQEAHLREVTLRNALIQERSPRPADGVTFGSGKPPEDRPRKRR